MYAQRHVTWPTSQRTHAYTYYNIKSNNIRKFMVRIKFAIATATKTGTHAKEKKSWGQTQLLSYSRMEGNIFPKIPISLTRPHMFLLVKWQQVNICHLIYPRVINNIGRVVVYTAALFLFVHNDNTHAGCDGETKKKKYQKYVPSEPDRTSNRVFE